MWILLSPLVRRHPTGSASEERQIKSNPRNLKNVFYQIAVELVHLSHFSSVECVPQPRRRFSSGPSCVCSLNKQCSVLFVYLAPKLAFSTSTSRPLSSTISKALSLAQAACTMHTAASFTSIIGNKVKEARVCRLGGGIPADQASV